MIRNSRDDAGNVNISHVNHEYLNLMKVLADVLAHPPIDISYAELVSKLGCDDDIACKAIGEYIGEHAKSARPDHRELLEGFGAWAVEWNKQFDQEPEQGAPEDDVQTIQFGDPKVMELPSTYFPDFDSDPTEPHPSRHLPHIKADELEAFMRSLPKDMSLKQLSEKLRVSKIRAVQIIYDFLVWNDDDAKRVGSLSAEEIESNIGLWAREALRVAVEQDVTFRNPDIMWLDSAVPVDVNELRYMICREHPDWHLLNVMRVFNLTKPDAIRMICTQVGHHYDELTRWHVEAMSEPAQRREGEDDE